MCHLDSYCLRNNLKHEDAESLSLEKYHRCHLSIKNNVYLSLKDGLEGKSDCHQASQPELTPIPCDKQKLILASSCLSSTCALQHTYEFTHKQNAKEIKIYNIWNRSCIALIG